MAPNVSVSVFKELLFDVFTENGYERKTLEKIKKKLFKSTAKPTRK